MAVISVVSCVGDDGAGYLDFDSGLSSDHRHY